MVLGTSELLRLVKEKNLVENLDERELTNPEGAGFDFRIGTFFEVVGGTFLGVTERETPKVKELVSYSPEEKRSYNLAPNVFYIMKTLEKVNVPNDILILFRPRSTLCRSGLSLFAGNINPGYNGELNFGIMNVRDESFVLEMGARVCHAIFFQVFGETASYRGQWQGGRTVTDRRETQV